MRWHSLGAILLFVVVAALIHELPMASTAIIVPPLLQLHASTPKGPLG